MSLAARRPQALIDNGPRDPCAEDPALGPEAPMSVHHHSLNVRLRSYFVMIPDIAGPAAPEDFFQAGFVELNARPRKIPRQAFCA